MKGGANVKYAIVLGDGMPDYPMVELGGKTPLAYARTPHMDKLARHGEVGIVRSVPPGMPPGSDVANLSVMGYNPARYYTGRSPIEAVAMGVKLAEDDLAFRCNLVTLSGEGPYERRIMHDYSAGEISTSEAREIIEVVAARLGNDIFNFYPGMSYRHLMVWRGCPEPNCFNLTPPHDITEKMIAAYLPKGGKSELLLELMEKSSAFLPEHPVNRERAARGLRPANSIWLWGQGRKSRLDSFREKYGLEGAVISAMDLIKGLGILAGFEVVDVPGATGNITTDFKGKARKALDVLLEGRDFVFIHVESPDEAGHQGDLEVKIRAIEEIDEKVVGEILRGLEEFQDYRLMVLSDHPTPLSLRTHTAEPVPFCIYKKEDPLKNPQGEFSESFAAKGMYMEEGFRLMNFFLGR